MLSKFALMPQYLIDFQYKTSLKQKVKFIIFIENRFMIMQIWNVKIEIIAFIYENYRLLEGVVYWVVYPISVVCGT